MLNSTHTKNKSEKKWCQRWKSVLQINEQCCICKNNGNRILVKLISYKKDYLKCTSKASYMSLKIFDNDLSQYVKTKFQLSKVFMYEFHYDYQTIRLSLDYQTIIHRHL